MLVADVTTLQFLPPSYNSKYASNRLDLINYLLINKIDADGDLLIGWLNTWGNGLLKVEDRRNLSTIGIYSLTTGNTTLVGNFYQISGFTILSASNNVLSNETELLISFSNGNNGITGTYNFDGSVIGTVSSMTIINGIITSLVIR